MTRAVDIVDDIPTVTYHQLVAQAGGKQKLRKSGHARVLIQGDGAQHDLLVQLVEHQAWRGGTRTYLLCPACEKRVLRLLWSSTEKELQCRYCWGPTQLRYRCQERRRLVRKEN